MAGVSHPERTRVRAERGFPVRSPSPVRPAEHGYTLAGWGFAVGRLSGAPEPWVYREVRVVLPLALVRAMFRRAAMWDLGRGRRLDKRGAATIVWSNSALATEKGRAGRRRGLAVAPAGRG